MKSGDVILKVDDVEYKGEDIDACSSALKSEEGTIAKLEILRDGQILNIDVERKTIKVNHIETQIIDNKIAYMDIATFDDGCYEEFAEKWEAIRQNNSNITGLIIDLRNNGGGIVTEATDIADMMTNKDKTLLVIEGKNEQEEVVKAKTDKIINIPIVILVNGETASASEILTAAVKENNENVTIVGTKTYGKGIIQTIYTLTDGSGLKLTTNEYYTPNGNSIHKIGITPDYEVEFPEGKTKYTIEQKDDTQLQKA